MPFDKEVAVLQAVEAARGVTVGFVPENSWHVLLPARADASVAAAIPSGRLVRAGARGPAVCVGGGERGVRAPRRLFSTSTALHRSRAERKLI